MIPKGKLGISLYQLSKTLHTEELLVHIYIVN